MPNEPGEFRQHLLAAEPLNAEAARRLQQEVSAMWNQKITRAQRLYWSASLAAAILFFFMGAGILIFATIDPLIRAIWWIYTLANLGFSILVGIMLKRREMNLRRFMSLGKLSPAATLAITLLLVIRAIGTPSMEALAWVLFGMVWLILATSINLWNRIIKSEMMTREQFLRLELLLMDHESRMK